MSRPRSSEVEERSLALMRLLWQNTGSNADWPIQITADADTVGEMCVRFNALKLALQRKYGKGCLKE